MTKLKTLAEAGQSLWLDYIRRGMTRSGELARWVSDGVRGVTSNPSIFQGAIAGSEDYADAMAALVGDDALDAMGLYEAIAIEDIKEACDVLRTVYDSSEGRDGFVSLEVAPGLARDTEGTLADARRLWAAVDRRNLMIKVPGTPQGIVAVRQLIADGINVNVTLIFAQQAYAQIARAYVEGLSDRAARGQPIDQVASVASFFVSRIDSEVDHRLESIGTAEALALRGKIAVANAKLAYRIYEELCATDEWKALAAKGARPQRLLWASTGTKNPAYSDVLYVDELIGRDTVNTVPPATLDAFVDHGTIAPTLADDVQGAQAQMEALASVGVDMDEVTALLLDDGLVKFEEAMNGLLATVAQVQRRHRGPTLDRTHWRLPGRELDDAVLAACRQWDEAGKTGRLWNRDASVWTNGPEAKWLGWLDIVEQQAAQAALFEDIARDVKAGGFDHVLLLGMGGSSLCPDVLARTYGGPLEKAGWPKLRILDSTVPAQVLRTHAMVDPAKTLFVVASKSGSTLEPTVFMESFLDRSRRELGDHAARNFIAITDPGSKLEAFATQRRFRRIVHGVPEIGGRFSALSNFGMVPAAAMGLDVPAFLAEARLMVEACRNGEAASNPGVALGLIMGTAASMGRDKLTLVTSPAIASFGAWLEQLVAESTGKQGKAIIPIDGETLADPPAYGDDRLFVYLRLRSTPDASQDRKIEALAQAGHPVVTIELADVHALPQEFFRWQIATATAGAVMGIDPFDQPDVEASKIASRAMTDAFEKTGSLPAEAPFFSADGIALFSDASNAAAMPGATLSERLAAHLGRAGAGDYVALLAYVDMLPAHQTILDGIRERIRAARGTATCVGFGPRFLHSTGQAYKGGGNNGVFLQITSDDAANLEIPGRKLDFGVVKAAQARGDFQVLLERGRRALRVHLGANVEGGLRVLDRALEWALAQERA